MSFLPVQDANTSGYTEARWTQYIQNIFKKHSGSSIGPTHLRSAFVTYLLDGQVSASDSLSRDVAAAMRHSVQYVSARKVTVLRICQTQSRKFWVL